MLSAASFVYPLDNFSEAFNSLCTHSTFFGKGWELIDIFLRPVIPGPLLISDILQVETLPIITLLMVLVLTYIFRTRAFI